MKYYWNKCHLARNVIFCLLLNCYDGKTTKLSNQMTAMTCLCRQKNCNSFSMFVMIDLYTKFRFLRIDRFSD